MTGDIWNLAEPVDVTSWRKLERVYSALQSNWIFRGEQGQPGDNRPHLQTSLERAAADFGSPSRNRFNIEMGLLRRFRRGAHHYLHHAPGDDDVMEWLALMQHYGAPTRLLDWTHSFYVAAFFAVEKATGPSVIWALNRKRITEAARKKLPPAVWRYFQEARNLTSSRVFKRVFARPLAFVCPVNPYRLNERLTIQQGLFLCPGDVTKSFVENLVPLLPRNPKEVFKAIKVGGDPDLRKELIRRLHRMNMNSAALFPGLEGFSRSLRTLMAFPPKMLPPDRAAGR